MKNNRGDKKLNLRYYSANGNNNTTSGLTIRVKLVRIVITNKTDFLLKNVPVIQYPTAV